MTKKKAFIVYATEDKDLTMDFVENFKNHNHDIEELIDWNPSTKNFNKQFKEFAEKCDLAIILASPRLMNPKHYSNGNEIPILIDRRDNGEIALVGIRLRAMSDEDLIAWNANGDIYFFQLINANLPLTRRNDPLSSNFNSQFANYEQIDHRDKQTFHAKLRTWVIDVMNTL